jgi:hypothetical protein
MALDDRPEVILLPAAWAMKLKATTFDDDVALELRKALEVAESRAPRSVVSALRSAVHLFDQLGETPSVSEHRTAVTLGREALESFARCGGE